MAGLDPNRIAQFFALPGAQELVEAFSAIPPGPVRHSIVVHAQALAMASQGAGAWDMQGETSEAVTAAPSAALPRPKPALEPPGRNGLKSTSIEGQIIERTLRGEPPKWVAQSLGVDPEVVFALQRKARKEGGIVFPTDAEPILGRSFAAPLPPPPWWWQDPESAIWDSPNLLPKNCNANGSLAAVGPMSAMAYVMMTAAAKKRGVTLRQYVATRWEIVQRAKGGDRPRQIAEALGVPISHVYMVLAAAGSGAMSVAIAQGRPFAGFEAGSEAARANSAKANAAKAARRNGE